MDNGDIEILIKEYEKLNKKEPDIYPLSFDEYIAGLNKSFGKASYLNAPEEKKIKVALLWLRLGRPLMKYYIAFKTHDIELLNHALYETAHLMQISNISNTGTDHGFYGMNISPNLLAANMMERVKLILPEENGLGKYTFTGTHIANLLMAIIYDNREFREEALDLSEKELSKKNPEYLKNWIKCMRAILLKDCGQINEQLSLFCKNYVNCKEFGMNGFNRKFCVEAHGMFNLAKWAYGGELKKKITMPQASNFCQELADFQEQHDYQMGEVVYTYPSNMDICNKLMHCYPPPMYLIGEGKKQMLDVDRYAKDIVKSIV